MKTTDNTIEFWRKHVDQSANHPVSKVEYCKENDLRFSTFFRWSKRFKDELSVQKKRKPIINSKKERAVFLPVQITPEKISSKEYSIPSHLPDARWVAEVMLHLVRGIS